MKLKFILIGLLLSAALSSYGQGKIIVKVVDAATKETLIGADVFAVSENKHFFTDVDGKCEIPISKTAIYSFTVTYTGYKVKKASVNAKENAITTLEVALKVGNAEEAKKRVEDKRKLQEIEESTKKRREEAAAANEEKRALDAAEAQKKADKRAVEMKKSGFGDMFKKPGTEKTGIPGNASGCGSPPPSIAPSTAKKMTEYSKDINIKGGRKEGTVYMVDGVRIMGNTKLPPPSEIETSSTREKTKEDKTPTTESDKTVLLQKTILDAALDIRAGRVTASENSDFKHWDFWNDKTKNEGVETYQKTWGFRQFERYPIVVTNEAGFPLSNVAVTLKGKDGRIYWSGRTDNLGHAETWAGMFEEQNSEVFIEIEYQGLTRNMKPRKGDMKGVHFRLDVPCKAVSKADICFIVDATSSMSDEINYLKQDLTDVVGRIKKANPAVDIRLGSVFYRDNGDDYLTRPYDFTNDLSVTQSFFNEQAAGGGGDIPEAVDAALGATMNLSWRDEADTKIAFLLLDAPPHGDAETVKLIQQYTMAYAKKGIKIIPISASGIDKSTEYLMRFMALATNGTYTYLTDDSGVGEGHIEATVSDVSVEFLNNLLTRIINQNLVSTACAEKSIATIQRIENQQSITNVDLEAKLFPVPASETITLDLSENVGDVKVFSLDGKAVLSLGKRDKGQHKIDISHLAAATYFMQIIKDGVMFGEKFVVLGF